MPHRSLHPQIGRTEHGDFAVSYGLSQTLDDRGMKCTQRPILPITGRVQERIFC